MSVRKDFPEGMSKRKEEKKGKSSKKRNSYGKLIDKAYKDYEEGKNKREE